jgi:pSer/pThr/pTyr-binding forkhead associated (FHA) protein
MMKHEQWKGPWFARFLPVKFPRGPRQMAVYLIPVDKGRPIVLDKAVVFIGRHPECDVILKASRKVSRKHCCLAQVESRIVIRDLGSMNGIRLNGHRVKKEATVKLGDEITIGDVTYVLKSRGRMDSESDPDPQWDASGSQEDSGMDSDSRGSDSYAQSRPETPPPKPAEPGYPEGFSPLGISQDFPVPIPEDPEQQFEREPRRPKSSSSHKPPKRAPTDEDIL